MPGTDSITPSDQRVLSVLAGNNYRRKDLKTVADVSNPSRNVDRLEAESLIKPVLEESSMFQITSEGVKELRKCALPDDMADEAEYRGGFDLNNWVNETKMSPTHFHVMYAIDVFDEANIQQIRECVQELNLRLYVNIQTAESVSLTFYRTICDQLTADGLAELTGQSESDEQEYSLTQMGERIVYSDRLWAVSGTNGLMTALLTEEGCINAAAEAVDFDVSASLATDSSESAYVDAQDLGGDGAHTDASTR